MLRNRDGSADTGVSMFMLLFWCGTGRANGFGGPVAPAESRAEADGDGGGRTTPDECESVSRRDGCDVTSVVVIVPRGDVDSAVALPPSDSSGICTFNRGPREMLPTTRKLLDREGGVKTVSGMDDNDPLLVIGGCPCMLVR